MLPTTATTLKTTAMSSSSSSNNNFNLKRASKDFNKMRKTSDKKVKKLRTEVADDISRFVKSDRVRREARNEELKNILEALDRFVKEEIGEVGAMLGNGKTDNDDDLEVTFSKVDASLDLDLDSNDEDA